MSHPHQFGAPLGQPPPKEPWPNGRVRLYQVRINRGGYDPSGTYWGIGQPLFCAEDETGERVYTRASNRAIAAGKLEFRYQRQILWLVKP